MGEWLVRSELAPRPQNSLLLTPSPAVPPVNRVPATLPAATAALQPGEPELVWLRGCQALLDISRPYFQTYSTYVVPTFLSTRFCPGASREKLFCLLTSLPISASWTVRSLWLLIEGPAALCPPSSLNLSVQPSPGGELLSSATLRSLFSLQPTGPAPCETTWQLQAAG